MSMSTSHLTTVSTVNCMRTIFQLLFLYELNYRINSIGLLTSVIVVKKNTCNTHRANESQNLFHSKKNTRIIFTNFPVTTETEGQNLPPTIIAAPTVSFQWYTIRVDILRHIRVAPNEMDPLTLYWLDTLANSHIHSLRTMIRHRFANSKYHYPVVVVVVVGDRMWRRRTVDIGKEMTTANRRKKTWKGNQMKIE